MRRRRSRLNSVQRDGITRRLNIQAGRYARLLEAEVAEATRDIWPELLAAVEASPDVRTDAVGGFSWLIESLKRALDQRLSSQRLRRILERQSDVIQQLTANELASMLGISADQIPVTDGVLEGIWVDRNSELGRDLAKRYVEGVERVLREARPGVRGESLIDKIVRRAQVARSAARRIAVNEVLSLHSTINQRRQRQLGYDRYEWSSSQDSRVRKAHQRLNGRIFRWDDPPAGGGTTDSEKGHPGDGILCRCVAIPRD